MKQYTNSQFRKILRKNGWYFSRQGKGDHSIYVNDAGDTMSVPIRLKPIITMGLIKRYNLEI